MAQTIAGVGLNSSNGTPNRFPPIGSGQHQKMLHEECWGSTDNTKTVVVVGGGRIIMIALRRTAIPRIVDPGAA